VERLFSASRHFALVGSAFGLLASLVAFASGAVRSVRLVARLFHGDLEGMAVGLVQVMESFLLGAGLLIFGLGLYELFVGSLALPKWLFIDSLDALKTRLVGVVVMVMAVVFLERAEAAETSRDVMFYGFGVAAVSATLVALMAHPRRVDLRRKTTESDDE
jgi:uncharacterized membrane protein YqhA